ncbi:MAG: hypothetical protein JXJ17_19045 [Anaerolineae bacterium]|nr:hypothetical protein [Anaerolineae bacterium]
MSKSKFTPGGRQLLADAQLEATQRNHREITCLHLVKAMLQQKTSIVEDVLKRFPGYEKLPQRIEVELKRLDSRPDDAKIELAPETRHCLEESVKYAQKLNHPSIAPIHLCIVLLQIEESSTYQLLHDLGFTADGVEQQYLSILEYKEKAPRQHSGNGHGSNKEREKAKHKSWPFPVLLVFMLATGTLIAMPDEDMVQRVGLFLFVVAGWLASISLHEFGHAYIAVIGGDKSVIGKGYLTLNPFRYTHPLYSIAMPLIFLLLGGVGLPGAAVYIDQSKISTRKLRSLVSAGGPLGTLGVIVTLLLILALLRQGYYQGQVSGVFWSAFNMLFYLNVMGLMLTLFPIPGFDGFGILHPFLPERWVKSVYRINTAYYFIGVYVLLSIPTLNHIFWSWVDAGASLIGVDVYAAKTGFYLFQFWR